MSYIGKVDMNDANIKHYSLTGSTLTTVNIGWTPASEQSLRVTINGVVQQGDTFSYSGANLTLGGPLVATDTLEVVGIESVGNIITPADNSVTAAKLSTSVSGRLGLEWQSVVTGATLTAVAGKSYPINTTSNACTVTLPASASVGDQVVFTDYARNWSTYAVTLDQGSLKFQGGDKNPVYDTVGESVHIVYMDVTKGWIPLYDGAVAAEGNQIPFDYLIVAGGGGGGDPDLLPDYAAGGGGAGGYKTGATSIGDGTVITVDVGAGGAEGINGENSSISGSEFTTITSTGGGAGGSGSATGVSVQGQDGGSGGGAGAANPGNRPYSEGSGTGSEGNDGGIGYDNGNTSGGGGGGATAAGQDGSVSSADGGDGGAGTANSITGASVTYAGGGGGGAGYTGVDGTSAGTGGAGGGGAGKHVNGTATAGTANTGGGGGGGKGSQTSGAGGSGIVILKIADADYSGTTSGTVSIDTSSVADYTILSYTGDGTYTA